MATKDDSIRFTAEVELGGKTATGICVPDEVVTALGAGKRAAVAVTVGTYTYRTTVAPMGGRFMVPLSAEHRAAAGVAAGDRVEVGIAVDAAPRTVEVPDDLAAALQAAGLTDAFEGLAFTHRKEHVRAVVEAKKPETRERRIAKCIEALST